MSRHSTQDRMGHLLACKFCWLRQARLLIRIEDQRRERAYYAAAGLPFPSHSEKVDA